MRWNIMEMSEMKNKIQKWGGPKMNEAKSAENPI